MNVLWVLSLLYPFHHVLVEKPEIVYPVAEMMMGWSP